MKLVIDSGGTSFKYLVADNEYKIIETNDISKGNVIVDFPHVVNLIKNILENHDISSAFVALAGWKALQEKKKQIITDLFSGVNKKIIISDSQLPLYSKNAKSIVSVISGTGSVITKRKDNKINTYLGYGYAIGDIGSGFDIGQKILFHALKNNDKKLLDEIKKILDNTSKIISYVYEEPTKINKKIASLTRLYNSKNKDVKDIVTKFVKESITNLSNHLIEVVEKDDVVILSGSIFQNIPIAKEVLKSNINNKVQLMNLDTLSVGLEFIRREKW